MSTNNFTQEINSFIDKLSLENKCQRIQMTEQIKQDPLYTPVTNDVKNSHTFGWMRGYTLEVETMIRGKWFSWLSIVKRGEYNEDYDYMPALELYPLIKSSPVKDMFKKCMSSHLAYGVDGSLLLDWIGYGLGISYFSKPKISDELWSHWFKHFDIGLMLLYPADYLSHFLIEYGNQSGRLDFYPTAHSLTTLMQKLINNSSKFVSTNSCYEPCSGTASLLLESNSINLVATDLSYTMVKATAIHAFLYLPYLLYVPYPILNIHVSSEEKRISKYFEFDTDTRIYQGDSLIGEYSAPSHIFEESSPLNEIYLNPLKYEKNSAIWTKIKYHNRAWESLTSEERFEVVRAQARHIKFDHVITNPPFSNHSKYIQEKINKIYESNKGFLEKYGVLLKTQTDVEKPNHTHSEEMESERVQRVI